MSGVALCRIKRWPRVLSRKAKSAAPRRIAKQQARELQKKRCPWGTTLFFVEGAASGIVGGVAAFFGVASEEVSQESATAAEAAHDRTDGNPEFLSDFFV